MAEPTIRVDGLTSLQRAFRLANTGIDRDLRSALESSAEPVRADASHLGLERISGMRRSSIRWNEMRVGQNRRYGVYIAPRQRGDKSLRGARRRPNLKNLLLDRAMVPALEQNHDRVEREVIDTLNDLARAWSRVG